MSASRRQLLSAALLFFAILLGGGNRDPLRLLVIQLLAVALIVVALLPSEDRPIDRAAFPMIGLAAAGIALLLLQLVPLPESWWHALPGREALVAVARTAGVAAGPRPLSLDPDLTRQTAATLLPPLAMFLATLRSTAPERRLLLMIVTGGAVLSLLLGFAQHRGAAPFPFSGSDYALWQRRYPLGLFANHNHQADILLLGILCAAASLTGRRDGGAGRLVALGVVLLLALGVVYTQSRLGILLLPTALLVAGALLAGGRHRALLRAALAVAMLIGVGVLVLGQNQVAQTSLARFGSLEDQRPVIWRTTLDAIAANWPAGSGFGTFVPVYKMFEQPQDVAVTYVVHAHNDYLEMLLEGGAPAALFMVGYLALLGWRLAKRRPSGATTLATAGIAILLVHSLADFSLRMPALATLFGMFNAMLFLPAESSRRSKIGHPGHAEAASATR